LKIVLGIPFRVAFYIGLIKANLGILSNLNFHKGLSKSFSIYVVSKKKKLALSDDCKSD